MPKNGTSKRLATTLPEPYGSAFERLCYEEKRSEPDMLRGMAMEALEARGFVASADRETAAKQGTEDDGMAST